MKNIIRVTCFLVIWLSIHFNTYSQSAIGGKFGFNQASLLDNSSSQSRLNLSLQTGFFFQFKVNNRFSIRPELLYIQKGNKAELIVFTGTDSARGEELIRFNYIDVPILGKIHLGDPKKAKFFIIAGPNFGYAISGKVETSGFDSNSLLGNNTFEIVFDDNFKRFEIGASVGFGFDFLIGPGNIFIETRYSISATNLINDDQNGQMLRNTGIGLSLGYLYSFGNK